VTHFAFHLLLVLAVAALAAAGLRVAAAAGARGVELGIGATVVVAAAAGISALALGLAGLGGSAAALSAAAALTYLAARRLPPAPPLPRPDGLLTGVALGVGAVWMAWLVRYPGLAIDPLTYHLPESVMWVQQGTPGSVEAITYEFPQGNYPVTNELLVAWLTGIGRSLSPSLFWTPALGILLAACAFRLPGTRRWLALAAVLFVPVAATQFLGPHTDLPALAWLAAAAALAPLPLALLAGALAVGTKTTVAPLVVLVIALKWRRSVPWRPVAAAALAGLVVGGTWYLRNWIDHGSPLWPFVATPWGDPLPRFLDAFDVSFLDRPSETLEGRTGLYVDLLGGGLVLLAGALVAAATDRRRAVLAAAGGTLLAALAWANAPFTGVPDDPAFDLSLTTTRYLLPAVAAAAVAIALARPRIAVVLLAAAALLSLQRALALPFPGVPRLLLLLAGAAAGAVALPFARRVPWPAYALLAALALTVAADGLGRRHGGIGRLASSGVISWMTTQPSFVDGDDPVSFAPQMLGVLAGDHLEHDIELIPPDEPCPATLARPGWIVIGTFPLPERRAPFNAARCFAGREPVYRDASFTVYARQLR